MGFIELLLIAVGLSMDAFAVSLTNGMCMKNLRLKWCFITALAFGLFQGVMPTIGYALGSAFYSYISSYDHYIAIILLSFIGGKMIVEAFQKKNGKECILNMTFGVMIVQAVATSIDALAVGVSFASLKVDIVPAVIFISSVTFVLSFLATRLGKKFGGKLNNKAEIIGGLILIGIGVKIFIEHSFFGG